MSAIDITKVPAATAPAGHLQHFKDLETNHNDLGFWVSVAGMITMTLFMALRVYTKALLVRRFGADDVALLVAWMISVALQVTICYMWAAKHIGVHLWDLYISEVNHAVLAVLVCSILYIPLMALAKISLLIFYLKLSVEQWFKYTVYGVMGLVVSYTTALAFALIFACTPLERNWNIAITSGHCIDKGPIYFATAGLNAGTDIILLILPMPMIIKLQVPVIQKLGLIAMFSIGALTLVTSVIRLSLLPGMVGATDTTWAISTPAIWICVEASLVIICGCLPILRLFFRHVAPCFIGERSGAGALYPGSPGRRPIHGVAELSDINGDKERQAQLSPHRVGEWDELERHVKVDDGSEECIMDANGRIIGIKRMKIEYEPPPPPPSPPPLSRDQNSKRKRSASSLKRKRLSVPAWFSVPSEP